jgi:hypothetical protein
MSFGTDLKRWKEKVEFASHEVFVNTASAAHSSIQNGSTVTGAPGQPVDTGNLKSSWQLNFTSPTAAEITTNVVYAKGIEEGISSHGTPITFRSSVGGAHSVALTRANLQRLVDDEARKLAR